MSLLISQAKKASLTTPGIWLRNNLGIRPVPYWVPTNVARMTCSDLFFWRSDDEFQTTFRFTDLPSVYYGLKESKVLLTFYDDRGNEIRRINTVVGSTTTEFKVDQSVVGPDRAFGTFSIFHLSDDGNAKDLKVNNRCYVGYSYKNSLPSFVHGNLLAQFIDLDDDNLTVRHNIAKTALRTSRYFIQKSFTLPDRSELLFSNPSVRPIWIQVGNEKKHVEPRGCVVFPLKEKGRIGVFSNLCFPRPVVFSYKNDFIDCHHG
jgi:hypothetical protein